MAADAQRKYRVAAIQMVSSQDVSENLAAAADLVAEAARVGAALVVLPEYFPIIGMTEEAKVRIREPEGDGPIQSFLAETAAKHAVWVIGGSVPLVADAPGKVRNSCLVFDARGRRVARYDKIHLFGFTKGAEHYNESETIEPGTVPVAFDTPFGRVGVAICYDVRFPELFRALGVTDLVAVPAAFTATTGEAHWELLLRARAVENQCYVVAAAQGGTHRSGRVTYGHSMVVDPWGEVLACHATGPGMAIAEVDPARAAAVRASLPALAHRRMR